MGFSVEQIRLSAFQFSQRFIEPKEREAFRSRVLSVSEDLPGGFVTNGLLYTLVDDTPLGHRYNDWLTTSVTRLGLGYNHYQLPVHSKTIRVINLGGNNIESLNTEIDCLREGVVDNSAVLIKGVPIANLDREILHIASRLGEPFVEANENSDLIQNIRPKLDLAHSQTSASSLAPLLDHVENAGTDNVPDWVIIGCVQNTEGAETTVLHPVKAMYAMAKDGFYKEIALLWDKKFWVKEPESFGGLREKKQGLSVFSESPIHPNVMADFADMGSDSSEHARAYELFREYCGRVRESICLEAGDILALRNTGSNKPYLYQQSMHGRGKFRADPIPGKERHLKRTFVRQVA